MTGKNSKCTFKKIKMFLRLVFHKQLLPFENEIEMIPSESPEELKLKKERVTNCPSLLKIKIF